MRKWLIAGAAALWLLGGTSIAARAYPVIDQATTPTVGCRTHADLVALIHGGTIQRGDHLSDAAGREDVVLRKKLAEKACFNIPAGSGAILRMRDQDRVDLLSGVALMHARDGGAFYTPAWAWQYVGDVR